MRVATLTFLRTALLVLAWAGLPATPQSTQPITLHIGLSRSSFPELNPKDLEGSFKVLVELLARKKGYAVRSEVRHFEQGQDIEGAMRRGELHMAVVGSWEFTEMETGPTMEPAFVHASQNRVAVDCLLLTRKDSGLQSLRDLKGKSIAVLDSPTSRMGLPWLDVLLADQKLRPRANWFQQVEIFRKASAVVLPVFFGKLQSCVVDRNSFELMAEMNPQVGSTLQVVASSPPFVSSILCLSRGGWPSDAFRNDVVTLLKDLHREPEGQQILMLFQIARLEPFLESQLASLRDLRSRHKRLGGSVKS